jgi:LysR family transcriptional regulator, cyn operon transcriptional activator
MNLQQLRYCVAVADLGTMTAAAERLHVSQPALSRAIRDLEDELHVCLFEKIGRNVVLTANATAVVDAARKVLAAVDEVTRAAESAAAAPLAVCTTSSVAALFAERLMPAILDRTAGRHMRLVHADGPEEIERAVVRGDAELGLIDREPRSGLAFVPLCEEEAVLVSPPGLELPDPLPVSGLDDLRLILPATGTARRRQCDEFFAAVGIKPLVVLESDDRSTWTSAVLNNVGSVLWYATNADDAARRGARVRSFTPRMVRPLYLVHREQELSAAAAGLLEALSVPVPG